jgi:hypothetical protein
LAFSGEKSFMSMPFNRIMTMTMMVTSRGQRLDRRFLYPIFAMALQLDLQKLLRQNVRPYVDFDHVGGAAAALPKRFYWTDEGVMLELDWTNAGKTAVSGRDYSYFSPTFLLDESGDPAGLPQAGSIGSLVNNPAFRSIRRIAARA